MVAVGNSCFHNKRYLKFARSQNISQCLRLLLAFLFVDILFKHRMKYISLNLKERRLTGVPVSKAFHGNE